MKITETGKKIMLSLICLCLWSMLYGQSSEYAPALSWKEIKAKARAENKYIVVDCYTTWCGPCKKMDEEIFKDKEVATKLRNSFIFVKLQMDKTGKDSELVRSRYDDAEELQRQYRINSFPCILFFSPDAELVYRVGFLNKTQFLDALKIATDPSRNLSGKYESFKQGLLKPVEMKKLASDLKKATQKEKALEVANFYKQKYLDSLPEDSLLKMEYFKFIVAFPDVVNSHDRFFKLFNAKPGIVDTVAQNPNFSRSFIDHVITREEINAFTRMNGKPKDIAPDWSKYHSSIETKYGKEPADKNVLLAQFYWYQEKKDWPNAIGALIKKVERQSIASRTRQEMEIVNSDTYNVLLKNTDNKEFLQKGITWLEEMLKIYPNRYSWIDTYACLLYRAGIVKEALIQEEKALSLAEKAKDKRTAEILADIIIKMKIGAPIPAIGMHQKSMIDTNIGGKWPAISAPGIGTKGNYASYIIRNFPEGGSTLYIQSTKTVWKKEIAGGQNCSFSRDERYAYYIHPVEGLVIQTLNTDSLVSYKGIKQYRAFNIKNEDWIAYTDTTGILVLRALSTNKTISYPNIGFYLISPDEKYLLAYSKNHAEQQNSLALINLATLKQKKIWQQDGARDFIFDKTGKQIAFLVKDKILGESSLWHYNITRDKATLLMSDSANWVAAGLKIATDNALRFSEDGGVLFFRLEDVLEPKKTTRSVMVDVWNYKDHLLQSEQLANINKKISYLGSVNLVTKKIYRLTFKNESSVKGTAYDDFGRILIIEKVMGNANESYWNPLSAQTTYMIDASTGARTVIKDSAKAHLSEFSVSPGSRFIVFYDPEFKSYFSIDLWNANKKINITEKVRTTWIRYDMADRNNPQDFPAGIVAWLDNEKGVLINDAYDIWNISPENQRPPENVTSKAGSKEQIVFSLAMQADHFLSYGENIYLKAFNTKTKACGFYSLVMKGPGKSELGELFMGNYLYEGMFADYRPISKGDLIGTTDQKAFLIRRESSQEFPNYYFTRNFREYVQISNIHPEKEYNWLSTELLTFSLGNGQSATGILYKPENFDPYRKYPLIFCFYDKLSKNLNKFPYPAFGGTIDISHFVSNGYLVFTPDIVPSGNHIGEGALKSVEAAARYLSAQPWVNPGKMGINAHSFGGYEAYYIVTHSKLFAAAICGAGMSNLTSAYGSLWGRSGVSKQSTIEQGLYRIKGTPWDNPKDYVDASPIFAINNVVTPVLIFHNAGDQSVPFAQGIEFFTGLRRAGKRAWLLQYDSENHSNNSRNTAADVENRFLQYFDHFLKDKPVPKWMTQGVPARMKGIEDGLELDIKTHGEIHK